MEDNLEDAAESPIQQFFAKRSVFVTGGTGFIGKLLVEKLLRCCPDIQRVYILIRSKKGKSHEERLDKLFEKLCFGPLKEKFPTFRDKVIPVVGDVVQPLCGINQEDLEALKRDVSIVFHSAASVQFFQRIRNIMEINVLGTRHVLELCKQLPLLASLVHVSTAFVRREPDFTCPEEIGGYHATANDVLTLLKVLGDDALELVASDIIKDQETTYQFSKYLAEILLDEEKENVPVSIIRPSIVVSCWKEPFPGYIDTYQGTSGLFVAISKGFIRTMWAAPGARLYMIPVDVVTNCVIAAAWYQATRRIKNPFVVNCATKFEDSVTLEEIVELGLRYRTVCPVTKFYRYPDITVYRNKWLYRIHAAVDHYIPAIIIDTLLFLFTGKTLMVPLYRKAEIVINLYGKHVGSPWYFQLENYDKVKNALSCKDAEIFFMNLDDADKMVFIETGFLGGRTFLLKDDPSTIPYAIKKGQIWWFVTTLLKWCLILFLIYYFIPQSFLDSAKTQLESYLYTPKLEIPASLDTLKFIQKPDANI